MDSAIENKFKVVIPAHLEKGEDGAWRVYGLASTSNVDQQGEVIDMKGIDLSPIEKGRGLFNFDHKKGPENTVGIIDQYKKTDEGLYLGGYLFKEHDRAKSLYQIMSSLNKSDRGRMGLSVEGVIKERAGKDGKVIKKAQIHSCALTMNPVNSDTYVNLVKSLGEVEFEGTGDQMKDGIFPDAEPTAEGKPAMFTADQVVAIIQKALSVGSEQATMKPSELTGGAALAQEDLSDRAKKKKKDEPVSVEHGSVISKAEDKVMKSLKKGDSALFKSMILEAMESLHSLYPEVPKAELWEVFKERLNRRFGEQKSEK